MLKYILKKYYRFDVHCLFKLLTKTKNIKYIRISPIPHINYLYCPLSKLITTIINKKRNSVSKILEMRITFVSQKSRMPYKQYLKQKKPMCEIKLNQILNRNLSLLNLLDISLPHPMINHFNSKVDDDDGDDGYEYEEKDF